jgi:hypothetical protein
MTHAARAAARACSDRSVHVKSILDPSFRYVASHATDLRKTFARVKREMRTQEPSGTPPRSPAKVVRLRAERKHVA